MKTFCVQTLGCKVNQYESEQLCSFLKLRGLRQTTVDDAELRIINTCSVTVQAASQSRQSVRRVTRLPVLSSLPLGQPVEATALHEPQCSVQAPHASSRPRVVVVGCWATSDKSAAAALPGVDAVFTHHDNLAAELDRLLKRWDSASQGHRAGLPELHDRAIAAPPGLKKDDIRWIEAGAAASGRTGDNKSKPPAKVNENHAPGANSLPLFGDHQAGRQRAFLKVQDGCDAHCTYCIIPQLRRTLWSKSIDQAVQEAARLVAAGHVELVLTGIFLGAYGQTTALRRRQPDTGVSPLARLVEALCKNVIGLRRVRLSSLEPLDLTDDLLAVLKSHPQVVPHFHLPLQSGSDAILRRMNRQYRRDDFLRMVEHVRDAFDRPALTTDIIVGFPDETDDHFEQTLDVARQAGFIHIHAFGYSPRPGTAAARWTDRFVRGPIVNTRIGQLRELAEANSLEFRRQFLGEILEVITERDEVDAAQAPLCHGRCERYFSVWFEGSRTRPGQAVRVRIERIMSSRTFGIALDQPVEAAQ